MMVFLTMLDVVIMIKPAPVQFPQFRDFDTCTITTRTLAGLLSGVIPLPSLVALDPTSGSVVKPANQPHASQFAGDQGQDRALRTSARWISKDAFDGFKHAGERSEQNHDQEIGTQHFRARF